MTTEEYRKDIQKSIPKDPGVYRFIDPKGEVLYVGKAKNLRNRLNSYFGSTKHKLFKTITMVKHADHIEFTIVHSEHDALLLENTLIKKYQPRYNVNLKDGKSYSYICIKNERFPRVFFTYDVVRDGSTYFGPYTSKYNTKVILDLIKRLFALRTCNFNLSEENINKGKFKVCLEYHINNCNGPCENLESEEVYLKKIAQVKNILSGNFKPVKDYIKEEMEAYASIMEFEKAQEMKEKLDVFMNYQAKSTVVSTTIKDVDVFSITSDDKLAFVNYLKVINGVVINAHTIEMDKNLDEEEAGLLSYVIPFMRNKFNSIAEEIIVPYEVEVEQAEIKLTIPQRGDKKKLLDMSQKNVRFFMLDRRRKKEEKQTSAERILGTLQKDLSMSELPTHIECFDNSNISGTNPTASCVVFKNAKPAKRDYRHFKIKTVEGPNDFASMEEVVYRRYSRLLEENEPLPQLIVIDGGKGQLSSAMKSINKLNLENKITVIGIAKKLEEIYFPEDPIPLHINKKSESLKLIQQTRDEAHRFALRLHRNLRSKNFIGSELTNIPGIGKKSTEKLLSRFGSLENIKSKTKEELSEVINGSQADKIIAYFNDSAKDKK